MSVSNATQEVAVPLGATVTYLSFFTNMPPEVVLGSFAGSVIFLLGVTNKPKWQWLLYFVLAFMSGLLAGDAIAEIASGILEIVRIQVHIPEGLGAMVASATVVNVVMWFRDNPTFFITRKGKGEVA